MATGRSRAFAVAFSATLGLSACALWLSACTLGLDLGREQCEAARDCAELGYAGATCVEGVCELVTDTSSSSIASSSSTGDPDPVWGCLGSFVQPAPAAGEKLTHIYRFELAIGAPGTPPKDLAVKLCNKLDLECATPIMNPVPDARGAITLDLDPAFDGFIEATSSETLPALVAMQKPVVIPQTEKVVRMASAAVRDALVAGTGEMLDETKGVALVLTGDCSDLRTAGVSVTSADLDETSVTFYFRGALPEPGATETDPQGAAGFINIPLGFVEVVATRASTGQVIGQGSFRSKAGVISYLPLGPTQQVQ